MIVVRLFCCVFVCDGGGGGGGGVCVCGVCVCVCGGGGGGVSMVPLFVWPFFCFNGRLDSIASL